MTHSRETEKQVIIAQLNQLGIFETSKGEALQKQTYHSLVSMLSIEQAVRS